jgi:hypothetical protein
VPSHHAAEDQPTPIPHAPENQDIDDAPQPNPLNPARAEVIEHTNSATEETRMTQLEYDMASPSPRRSSSRSHASPSSAPGAPPPAPTEEKKSSPKGSPGKKRKNASMDVTVTNPKLPADEKMTLCKAAESLIGSPFQSTDGAFDERIILDALLQVPGMPDILAAITVQCKNQAKAFPSLSQSVAKGPLHFAATATSLLYLIGISVDDLKEKRGDLHPLAPQEFNDVYSVSQLEPEIVDPTDIKFGHADPFKAVANMAATSNLRNQATWDRQHLGATIFGSMSSDGSFARCLMPFVRLISLMAMFPFDTYNFVDATNRVANCLVTDSEAAFLVYDLPRVDWCLFVRDTLALPMGAAVPKNTSLYLSRGFAVPPKPVKFI